MQDRFIVAVDLGASKISLSVSQIVDGAAQLVHYSEAESSGIRHGVIFNPKKVCEPLGKLIKEAEEAIDIKITEVITGFPRWKVTTDDVGQSCTRSNPDDSVTEEEISNLKGIALGKFETEIDPYCQIYDAVAQSYSTEDLFQIPENDIVGVTSAKIEGQYKVFSGAKKPVQNIVKVMNELEISSRQYFLADAVADTVLTGDEKEHGVALVEIGAGVTSVSVYHRGILRFYDSFPFGGKSVTSDIHLECGIQEKLAENIKLGFGSCMPDRLQTLGEKILQIWDNSTEETLQIPVKYLSEVIGCRMREIANAALFLIGKSGYADNLRGGIVLAGGGAEMLSCRALFTELSGLPARIAIPHPGGIVTEGFPEILKLGSEAQLAMIALAKDLEFVNCAVTKESEAAAAEVPAEEPADAPSELFGDEPVQESGNKNGKKPEKKKRKPIFGRLNETVGTLFDNNFGNSEEDNNNA